MDLLPFQILMKPKHAQLFQRMYTNMNAIGQMNEKGLYEVLLRIDNSQDVASLIMIGRLIGASTYAEPVAEMSLN